MQRQRGFTAVEAIIIIVVIVVLGLGAWFVFSKNRDKDSSTSDVTWSFNGDTWEASDTPPACPDPLLFPKSPVDSKLASSLLFPGQYRGNDYKPHGGFRFDGSKSTDVTVTLPMDAQLTGLVRYIEGGDVQYVLSFLNSCGIMMRFDHIFTLSNDLQTVAETTPEPKVDDTSGLPLQNGPVLKAGDIVGTAVGNPKNGNIFLDFGVYDLRDTNKISQNAQWAYQHSDQKEQAYYGVCWFDMLPEPDKSTVNKLATLQADQGDPSDYCSIAKRTTLD